MGKNLIIAAYDRDYSWVSHLNNDVKVTVYNKNVHSTKPNEILISPNVGRCVHTFFWHLVHNYDSLDDYTITSQDDPFDHVMNYPEIINGDINTWNLHAKQNFGGCWFFNTGYSLLECDIHGNPSHGGLNIEHHWTTLFNEPVPTNLRFTPAGHFIVSKEHVRKRPKKFYEKVLNLLDNTSEFCQPNNCYATPWVIERLEPYIFDLNIKIND